MKRLYIVVEGETEQEFVKNLIAPFFYNFNIFEVTALLINTSKFGKGGFVNYEHLKNDVIKLLKSEKNIIVTMFVDYFRIPKNIPNYSYCCNKNTNIYEKVLCLEKAIEEDISDNRFIPYIQLHEFEALLFSSNIGFEKYFEMLIFNKTKNIINKYENPELINDNPTTSPSKRLLSIINNYDKVIHGNIIALEIGFSTILEKCKRFENWINLIKQKIIPTT